MIAALRTGFIVWLFTVLVGCVLVPLALTGFKLEYMDVMSYLGEILPAIFLLSIPSLVVHLVFNAAAFHLYLNSLTGLIIINLLAGLSFFVTCQLYFGGIGFSWLIAGLFISIILIGDLLAFLFLYKTEALPSKLPNFKEY
jgi:hypothetical protein